MKVKFLPQNIEIEITPDKSVLQVAHENGIPIRSLCKGVPSCAECRVKVLEGENHLLPPTKAEVNLIGSTYFVDQRRLACQLRCFGDVTIDVAVHLEKDESSSKRLRGVKHTSLPQQTRAIQGTLVLDEGAATGPDDSADSSTDAESPRGDRSQPRRRSRPQGRGGSPDGPKSADSGNGSGSTAPKNKDQKRKRNRNRRPRKKQSGPSPQGS